MTSINHENKVIRNSDQNLFNLIQATTKGQAGLGLDQAKAPPASLPSC